MTALMLTQVGDNRRQASLRTQPRTDGDMLILRVLRASSMFPALPPPRLRSSVTSASPQLVPTPSNFIIGPLCKASTHTCHSRQ